MLLFVALPILMFLFALLIWLGAKSMQEKCEREEREWREFQAEMDRMAQEREELWRRIYEQRAQIYVQMTAQIEARINQAAAVRYEAINDLGTVRPMEPDVFYMPRIADNDNATQKAEALLKSHLNPEQLSKYEKDRRFTVTCPSGNKYAICSNRSFNVRLLGPEGNSSELLCLTSYDVPIPDLMLAQKFRLETDEAGFRKEANILPSPDILAAQRMLRAFDNQPGGFIRVCNT